ncbi:MAG: isoprenylcysteine carboxylmethyltransferase family protein [Candidatus Tumulicola sp.]
MTHKLAALAIVLLVGIVLTRTAILRRRGIVATKFGAIDKTDFLIPPFALFYFYLIFASALHSPSLALPLLFTSAVVAWAGVGLCAAGLGLMAATLVAFGSSFRIGIDMERPDSLVTTGLFAYSRNPMYVAFTMVLSGQFLVLPTWLFLLYLFAFVALFHRQVLREEVYLASHYGNEYQAYRKRVRRYI